LHDSAINGFGENSRMDLSAPGPEGEGKIIDGRIMENLVGLGFDSES
jgi:hypothetical protein